MLLPDRWHSLCARVGVFGGKAEARGDGHTEESELTYDMVATLYAHPAREYHGLGHIEQLLGVFDGVKGLAEDRDAVEFAIWLHDCVYFAERPDNEERSADAAAMIAGLLGCQKDFVERVRGMIAATRHSVKPATRDAALMADIDLMVLAGTVVEYDEYRRAIRREFAFADDAAFRDGRIAFLRKMLDRETILYTPYLKREHEGKARANLERELEELEAAAR